MIQFNARNSHFMNSHNIYMERLTTFTRKMRIFKIGKKFFPMRCIRLSMVAITDNKLILVPFFSYFLSPHFSLSLSPSQHSSLPVARHSKRKMQPNAISRSSLFRVSLPKDIPEDQPLSPASTVSTDSFSSLGK